MIAPLGLDRAAGVALNLNADTAAGAIAGALQADAYVVLTNVAGVRRDRNDPAIGDPAADRRPSAGVPRRRDLRRRDDRPKMRAAIDAVRAGARRALIAAAGRGRNSGGVGGTRGPRSSSSR